MAFCCDYVSEQNFEPSCLYGRFLFSFECWELLAQNLGDLPFDQVIPMLFLISYILAQFTKIWQQYIITFLHCTIPYASSHKHQLTSVFITLSKSVSIWCNLECIIYNLVVIEYFRWPLLACYLLELYLVPTHWIHFACLTFRWPSSITLFVALNLVDSISPNCYLGKPSLSIHGPLGCRLQSVAITCRERKLIARFVNFLSTSESVELKPYSLCEAYLKVGVSGWSTLLNCNLVLNCAGSSKRFSSQYCKIEIVCLIELVMVFHSWFSSKQDGILLDIRNRNEESFLWNLVATTSLNLTIISLPWCQTFLDTSVTMFVMGLFVAT
jgi:hypothetical protein